MSLKERGTGKTRDGGRDLWIDADVLLRLLTSDPPPLARRAQRLVERAEAGEVVLHLSPVVVAEMATILTSYYGYTRERVAEVLQPFVVANGLAVEDEDLVAKALSLMAREDLDFNDAYLAALAGARGGKVCSFGEEMARVAERVPPG